MQDDAPLRVTASGSLVWAKAPKLKAALEAVEESGIDALRGGVSTQKTALTVALDAQLYPAEWGRVVQALQTAALTAQSGAVRVALPELGDEREVRAGGAVVPVFLDREPARVKARIGRRYLRVPGHATAVAFSEDGRRVALASGKCSAKYKEASGLAMHLSTVADVNWGSAEVRVWDRESTALVTRLLGRSTHVQQMQLSPDGSLLLCVSCERAGYPKRAGKLKEKYARATDFTLRLFDLRSGEETIVAKSEVQWSCFSPDGSRFAALTEEGGQVWQTSPLAKLSELPAVKYGDAMDASFNADGRYLLVTRDWRVECFDAVTGAVVPCGAGGGSTNTANAVWLPGRDVVYQARTGRCFEVPTGAEVPSPLASAGPEDPRGKGWAHVDAARGRLWIREWSQPRFHVWELATGAHLGAVATDDSYAAYMGGSVAVDPTNGDVVETTYSEGAPTVLTWRLGVGRAPDDGGGRKYPDIVWSLGGALLLHDTKGVRVYDAGGKLVADAEMRAQPVSPDLTRDGHFLATTRTRLRVTDLRDGSHRDFALTESNWAVGKFSPDGARWACTSGEVPCIVTLATGAVMKLAPVRYVSGAHFVDDGRVLILRPTESKTEALLIDARTGDELRRVELLGRAAYGVARSPDAVTLAVVSPEHEVRMYDARTLDLRPFARTLEPGWLLGAVSADGKRVALRRGHATRVLAYEPGEIERELFTACGFEREGYGSMAFSPDGATLAQLGADGTVVLWDTKG